MKKRVLCLVLAIVVCMTFVACGTPPEEVVDQPEPVEKPAETPTQPPEAPEVVEEVSEPVEEDPMAAFNQKMVIAHLPKSVGGAWYTRMFQGFGRYSGETGSETFQIGPSVGDAAAQNRNVQDLVAQGVDVIAVSPFAPEQIDAELKKAREAGIIVISNEGEPLENIDYDVEAFDNAAFGAMAADELAKGMNNEGEIIIFVGSLGSTSHVGWAQGIVDTIEVKYPDMKVANKDGVFIETGNNAAQSYEKAKEALKAYPHAKGVFCPSATDTPSIARAIEEAGLMNQITYVAVGLPNANRTYVKSGAINVLMSWDPAEVGLVMCKVAGAVKSGVELKDGDDLGVFGFNKISLKGKVIKGTEWRVITADDIDNYNY
ncbi:MAG: substrate-binding domain-containing protein [Caldicoprobacterales bacterium]|jgi:simple sugar transport system substrate-binding protein